MRGARSEWGRLLDLAIPVLEHVFGRADPGRRPDWTMGGGTALMLHIGHRVSHDIDVFVPGVALKAFTPNANPAARRISERFQWPGHYLKYERPEGEIDFLSAPLQTEPGFQWRRLRDHDVAIETPEEIIVKKIRYRSASFTPRDAFDLAAVGRDRPDLPAVLAREVPDTLRRLGESLRILERNGTKDLRKAITPIGRGIDLVPDAYGRAREIIARASSGIEGPHPPPGNPQVRPPAPESTPIPGRLDGGRGDRDD